MGPPHRLPWAPAAGRRTASLARGLKALAHPVRLEMLAILSRAGQSLCELEANLPVKQPTVSRHLRAAGLLGREQRGVWAYYSVRPDRLAELWSRLAALTGHPSGVPVEVRIEGARLGAAGRGQAGTADHLPAAPVARAGRRIVGSRGQLSGLSRPSGSLSPAAAWRCPTSWSTRTWPVFRWEKGQFGRP